MASPSDVCSAESEARIQVMQLEDLQAIVETMVHEVVEFLSGVSGRHRQWR